LNMLALEEDQAVVSHNVSCLHDITMWISVASHYICVPPPPHFASYDFGTGHYRSLSFLNLPYIILRILSGAIWVIIFLLFSPPSRLFTLW
jgi:hypothetical protein